MENCYIREKLEYQIDKGENWPKLVRIGKLTYIWMRESGKKYENQLGNGEIKFLYVWCLMYVVSLRDTPPPLKT